MRTVRMPFPLALASLALVGFTSQGTPVEILPEADECATCSMAVQDMKAAAEATFRNGDVKKFDDIGCMARYLRRKKVADHQLKGLFVHDLVTGRWLVLERATLVKSKYPTPMRYGFVAFARPEAAKRLDKKYQGKVVTWSSVLKEF